MKEEYERRLRKQADTVKAYGIDKNIGSNLPSDIALDIYLLPKLQPTKS